MNITEEQIKAAIKGSNEDQLALHIKAAIKQHDEELIQNIQDLANEKSRILLSAGYKNPPVVIEVNEILALIKSRQSGEEGI